MLTSFSAFQKPPYFGAVAQLVRASPCHGEGCGFEPRQLRHFILKNESQFILLTKIARFINPAENEHKHCFRLEH